MTIKEVEKITGLARSNIYFYEKEKLIQPLRKENNGYREYSDSDIREIKKIAYLRTLGISIEDIRKLSEKTVDLLDVVKGQEKKLEQDISELQYAKQQCECMLSAKERVDYENLDVEMFVDDVKDYWSKNKVVFKIDAVSFFFIWGRCITWGVLTVLCLVLAVLSFRYLPTEIPVQWSNGAASSFVDKKGIFAFPVACILIRFALRPFIWRWLRMHVMDNIHIEQYADYIGNYLCFVALSVECFIILFTMKIMEHVTVVLFIDTVVLIGIMLVATHKMSRFGK